MMPIIKAISCVDNNQNMLNFWTESPVNSNFNSNFSVSSGVFQILICQKNIFKYSNTLMLVRYTPGNLLTNVIQRI